MGNNNLKIKIFLLFFLYLSIGMTLIGLLSLHVYQRTLISTAVDKASAIAGMWMMSERNDQKKAHHNSDLALVCNNIGETCEDVFISDNQGNYFSLHNSFRQYEQYVQRSFTEKKEILIREDLSWATYFFQHKTLIKFIPDLQTPHQGYVFGFRLNLSPVLGKTADFSRMLLFYIILNAIIGATLGLFRLTRVIIKPMDKLVRVADDYMNTGEFSFFAKKSSHEFGTLNLALNNMMGRINDDKLKLEQNIQSLQVANQQLQQSQQQVIRAEKLAAVGRLSAGIAHEIGNPIGIALGYIELLENDDLAEEERKQYSERAVKELRRIDVMIRQLLDFSREKNKDLQTVSVGAVLEELYALLTTQNYGIELETSYVPVSEYDVASIGHDDLYQVLVNCSLNSIDSIKDRGKGFVGHIEITAKCVEKEGGSFISIHLKDNGQGIKQEDMNSIFDPFFTTKDVGEGTGLGLSVSYSIIESSGGTIAIDSQYGEGTNIYVYLPLA